MTSDIEIDSYLPQLRNEHAMPLIEVVKYIVIDVSMLSKIEHIERQLQSHLITPTADLFEINYSKLNFNFSIRKSYRKLETNHTLKIR